MPASQITRQANAGEGRVMIAAMEGVEHLFVYGTLMTAAAGVRLGRPQRARLQREAASLGPATMEGRLYDLGRYPALTAAVAAGERVHGEVFRLADAARSLTWLDAYEDVVPGNPHREYDRVLREAVLASGAAVEAWVYLFRGELARARHLPDGCWQPQAITGR